MMAVHVLFHCRQIKNYDTETIMKFYFGHRSLRAIGKYTHRLADWNAKFTQSIKCDMFKSPTLLFDSSETHEMTNESTAVFLNYSQ